MAYRFKAAALTQIADTSGITELLTRVPNLSIATTTGNWGTAGTWLGSALPVAGDNIIVNSGVTLTVAADLDLSQYGTLQLLGSGVLNIAALQTVLAVPAGWVININRGTVTTNYGTVTTNYGIVTNNVGTVMVNYDTVALSYAGFTVEFNYGTVTVNDGTVSYNYSGGTVGVNNGTVIVNKPGATITTNSSTVTINLGTVDTNSYSGGMVESNYGTVTNNRGVVEYNYATITTNYSLSTVLSNIGTVATNNSGGKVFNALGGVITTNNGTATTYSTQISCDAALVANNLDHLALTAASIPTLPAGTYLDQARSDGTAVYDRTTDSQQAIRDRGDAAWVTATGFATPTNITAGTITTVTTVTNKTGYSLAATGLDAITIDTPTGAIGTWNFRQRMVMLFRRFFGKAIKDTSTNTLRTYDGSTVLTTQTIAETATSETQGEST
jgi:hypothetical protein